MKLPLRQGGEGGRELSRLSHNALYRLDIPECKTNGWDVSEPNKLCKNYSQWTPGGSAESCSFSTPDKWINSQDSSKTAWVQDIKDRGMSGVPIQGMYPEYINSLNVAYKDVANPTYIAFGNYNGGGTTWGQFVSATLVCFNKLQ